MTKKRTVIVTLREDVAVEVKGNYFGGYEGSWEEPPEEPEFEVISYNAWSGDLNDVLNAIEDKQGGESISELFSRLALEQISNED
jgi:hypothetical protein